MNHDHPFELEKQILIIDTEASGLNPLYHSILSIGLCTLNSSSPVNDTGTSLKYLSPNNGLEIFVNEPSINVDPRAMAIHGITLDELAQKGLRPTDACVRFESYLAEHYDQNVILAGHNVNFDVAYMKRLYRIADRTWPEQLSHRVVDTHSLLWALACAQKIPKDACNSDGAFEFFKCAPPEALRHSALGDAIATGQLLSEVLKLIRS